MATRLATSRDQGHGFDKPWRVRRGLALLRQGIASVGGDGAVAKESGREAQAAAAHLQDGVSGEVVESRWRALPKMRWGVYDPPHLTNHFTKVTGMAEKRSVCAECGLTGWNWKCAECGCESGIRQGSPGYGPAVNDRAARMKMKEAAEGSPSMDTGQPSTSSPATGSADQTAAGSTSTPPADSGRDRLSTAIRHFAGGDAAVFTGSEPAASLGRFFVVLGWIVVGLSVIGGIVLISTTESTGYGNEHPNVLLGLVVMASGSIQGFVLVMIGSFVQATLEFQSLVGGFFKRLKTLSL